MRALSILNRLWLQPGVKYDFHAFLSQLRVTLLAAGFVIGASGASVREISQVRARGRMLALQQ